MPQSTQDGNGSGSGKPKVHACGHRGFGQWCHRCAAADSLEKNGAESKFGHAEKDTGKIVLRVKALRAVPA